MGNTALFFQSFDTLFIVVLYCPRGGGGRGHFQSKVIGMLVLFLGFKILILVFLGSSGKFLENGSHFSQNSSQNSPKNCNFGIFKGLKSKSEYFKGFSKKFPMSMPTTSTLRVSQNKMNEHFCLQRRKIKEENVPIARFLKYLIFPKF